MCALLLGGCDAQRTTISADSPELATFVSLMMPRKIEIQPYLTQPRSLDGSGNANGMEVILAAKDAFGDDVKCVGTFIVELYTQRPASGDKLGKRVGFWNISINSEESQRAYWDRLSRFYNFKLELDSGRLEPGAYVLTVQLTPPTGDKLFSEYAFNHGSEPAQKAKGKGKE
jgi:hypothetical protein